MKFAVRVKGPEQVLSWLVEAFPEGEDLHAFEESGDIYFTSKRLRSCESTSEALDVAGQLINIIKGVRFFEIAATRSLDIDELGVFGPNGFRPVTATSETVSAVTGVSEDTFNASNFRSADEYQKLAEDGEDVGELISLLCSGSDWVNMYRVFEFIQDHPIDDQSLVDKGWISKSEKNRFTGTANSRAELGDDARHAKESDPLSDPMERMEALNLIAKLSREWLNERVDDYDSS